MTKVRRITVNDNLDEVVNELQSNKWETLTNSATRGNVKTFLQNRSNYLLLAYKSDKIVGMLTAHRLDKLDNRRCEFLLYEIEAKSEHRQAGIGRALVKSLIAHARKQKAHEVWVLTEPDNQPARKLYNSFTGKKPKSELMYTIEL